MFSSSIIDLGKRKEIVHFGSVDLPLSKFITCFTKKNGWALSLVLIQ